MIYNSIIAKSIAHHDGTSIALYDTQSTVLTYADLRLEVATLAHYLESNEIRNLALDMSNCPAWVVADLAALEARTWTLPLPAFFSSDQRSNALARSACEYILSDKNLDTKNCTLIDTIEVANKQLNLYALINKTRGFVPKGTSKITFTSGSTANPKGLCLSEQQLLLPAQAICDNLANTPLDRHLTVLPLCILLENVAGVYAALLRGMSIVIPDSDSTGLSTLQNPNIVAIVEHLQESKAHSCIVVPELLKGLLSVLEKTHEPLPHMRYIAVGGAPVSGILLKQAKMLGLSVYEGYGLSEAASVVAVNTQQSCKTGSVGKLLAHHFVTISDEQEILLETACFLGYCQHAEQPPAPFPTGDIGWLDDEGYLFVSGRRKNVIINPMGRNISPEWIESSLSAHAAIEAAFVYLCPKGRLSALLVSNETTDTLQKMLSATNRQLPDYASIKHFRRVAPFTREDGLLTNNGKLRRQAIVDYYCLNDSSEFLAKPLDQRSSCTQFS